MSKFEYLSGLTLAPKPKIPAPELLTPRQVWEISRDNEYHKVRTHIALGEQHEFPTLTWDGKLLGLTFDRSFEAPRFNLEWALNEIMILPATQTVLRLELEDHAALKMARYYGVTSVALAHTPMNNTPILTLHLAPFPSLQKA